MVEALKMDDLKPLDEAEGVLQPLRRARSSLHALIHQPISSPMQPSLTGFASAAATGGLRGSFMHATSSTAAFSSLPCSWITRRAFAPRRSVCANWAAYGAHASSFWLGLSPLTMVR